MLIFDAVWKFKYEEGFVMKLYQPRGMIVYIVYLLIFF